MQRHNQRLDVGVRSRAKQASRLDDERAMSSGRKSAAQLRVENEAIAPFARAARVNLRSSRSLG